MPLHNRLDIPAFYQEAARILRPNGTIALFCYDIWDFPDQPKATEVMIRYFDEVLKPYWLANWQLIRGHYKGAEPQSESLLTASYHTCLHQSYCSVVLALMPLLHFAPYRPGAWTAVVQGHDAQGPLHDGDKDHRAG